MPELPPYYPFITTDIYESSKIEQKQDYAERKKRKGKEQKERL
jgi:hypothetical protein